MSEKEDKIENKCPKCGSYVKELMIEREHCQGPHSCLSNVPGKHTHVMSICPFCGHVFVEFTEDGWT
jgi:hypothetical protein